jgi:hypothetical protein
MQILRENFVSLCIISLLLPQSFVSDILAASIPNRVNRASASYSGGLGSNHDPDADPTRNVSNSN